jgi:RNA-directed DNA polymerase
MSRFKARVVDLTGRHRGIRFSEMLCQLNTYLQGWCGYYLRLMPNSCEFRPIDQWIRRRLRMYRWVQWKTRSNRLHELIKGGASRASALQVCGCPGVWRASHTPAVDRCMSVERLSKAGFVSLEEYYRRLKP